MARTAVIITGFVALAAVTVAVVLILLGGDDYKFRAQFVNASQLVNGDVVKVAGERVGTVSDIKLTANGDAMITMKLTDKTYSPLRKGTHAIVRVPSLSTEAGRYVELQLGPAGAAKIPQMGMIPSSDTSAVVELDSIFNVFDPVARTALQRDIRGFGEMYAGREKQANAAARYFSPALGSASRLFQQINRNTPEFEQFLVQTAKLTTELNSQSTNLRGVIDNVGITTNALATQGGPLDESLRRLPDFLRRSDTTFVNLRNTLNDVTPLVNVSKPVVANKLRPLLSALRPFARDARPTVRDLSRTIRQDGPDNDLIDLNNRLPALDRAANDDVTVNGQKRPGAFPASIKAFQGTTPNLAYLRPYANDLVGWFDDFSSTGAADALGNFSRAGLGLSGFTVGPLLNGVNQILPVPPDLRNAVLGANTRVGLNNRCPGSIERTAPDGSNPFRPSDSFNCDPTQKPTSP